MPCGGTDDFEVVVVGAGAAGLGTAMRLAAARVYRARQVTRLIPLLIHD